MSEFFDLAEVAREQDFIMKEHKRYSRTETVEPLEANMFVMKLVLIAAIATAIAMMA